MPFKKLDTVKLNEAKGICIQGYEGSFHQVAARQFFGKQVKVLPCASFRELIKTAGPAEAVDFRSQGRTPAGEPDLGRPHQDQRQRIV